MAFNLLLIFKILVVHLLKKSALIAVVAFGFTLAAAQTGTNSQKEKSITVDGISLTKTFSSNGGNADIEGVNNVITINGTVGKLVVSGTGNQVYGDKVSSIRVDGTGNRVYYRSAPTKTGKPATAINGYDNSVQKQ